MTVRTSTISFSTHGNADFHDITQDMERAVSSMGLRDGIAVVFCPSATSAVTTIEYEAGALNDLRRVFDEIVPQDREYAHNARWGDGNGHSHVRASLLGPSLSVPVISGRLALGTWQQVVHVDFDNGPRQRELIVQLIGD
jgi:secondary thiamine-phosphate synthase enzyme